MSIIGSGNIAVSSKTLPGGAPFPAGSAANGLSVDPVTGQIVLGNDVGDFSGILTSNRDIYMDSFVIDFRTAALDSILLLNSGTGEVQLGDIVANGYGFSATPAAGLARMYVANNAVIDASMASTRLGTQALGQTEIELNQGFTSFSGAANVGLYLDYNNSNYYLGDAFGQVNNTKVVVDDSTQVITLDALNGIVTAPPPNGAQPWKLGSVIAGAAVLDAANYVEVDINGTPVKLAIIV